MTVFDSLEGEIASVSRTSRRRPRAAISMDPALIDSFFGTTMRERLERVAEIDLGLNLGEGTDFADPVVASELHAAEVLITGWASVPVDRALLERMPNLRLILHTAGSVKSHIDPVAFERGIAVCSAAAANAIPVAEYTLAAIIFAGKGVLSSARRYRSERRYVAANAEDWPRIGNYRRTVGLIGLSRIGQRVLELLAPFDFEVLAYDPYVDRDSDLARRVELVELDALVDRADIISVHAPQTAETYHLLDRRLLERMRWGTTVINTARGALIDQEALTDAIADGRLRGILDVTDPEVLPADDPLYDLPGAFLTPHVAGSQGTEFLRLAESVLDDLENYRAGLPLAGRVDVATLGWTA